MADGSVDYLGTTSVKDKPAIIFFSSNNFLKFQIHISFPTETPHAQSDILNKVTQ